jgi:hypothetical protein
MTEFQFAQISGALFAICASSNKKNKAGIIFWLISMMWFAYAFLTCIIK